MNEEYITDLIDFIKEECQYIIEEDDIIFWVRFYDLKELTDILGENNYFFDDGGGGIDITLFDDCVALCLSHLFLEDEEIEFIKKELKKEELK